MIGLRFNLKSEISLSNSLSHAFFPLLWFVCRKSNEHRISYLAPRQLRWQRDNRSISPISCMERSWTSEVWLLRVRRATRQLNYYTISTIYHYHALDTFFVGNIWAQALFSKMLVHNDIAELLLVQVRNCMEQNEGGLNTHRSSLSQGAVFEKAFSHTSVFCASNLTLTFTSPARVGRSGGVREYYGQKRGGKSGLIPFPRCSRS